MSFECLFLSKDTPASEFKPLSFSRNVCVPHSVVLSFPQNIHTHTHRRSSHCVRAPNEPRFPWAETEEKTDQQAALPCGLGRDRGCEDVPVIGVISANRTRGLSSLHVRVLCQSSRCSTRGSSSGAPPWVPLKRDPSLSHSDLGPEGLSPARRETSNDPKQKLPSEAAAPAPRPAAGEAQPPSRPRRRRLGV